MADNNTTQISKVLIDTTGDKQGDITAHFAADIDNFMVYTDTATAHSVKDLVFGDTPPSDFITKGDMWTQLKTQADKCQTILSNNASFWNGLSNDNYIQPSPSGATSIVNGKYLASGDQINALRFYGEDAGDSMEGEREKLISLGALEDFAKRIPTMGGTDGIALGVESSANQKNSFAVSGGDDTATNTTAIGPGTIAWSREGQVVLGQYNELSQYAAFLIGIGENSESRKTGLKLIPANAQGTGPQKTTLYVDAFHTAENWIATCDFACGKASVDADDETKTAETAIQQPLQHWTKATVLLTGYSSSGSRLSSTQILIMPDSAEYPSKVYWYSPTVPSDQTAYYIKVSAVEYTNNTIKIKTSTSGIDTMEYACEFTGMAM